MASTCRSTVGRSRSRRRAQGIHSGSSALSRRERRVTVYRDGVGSGRAPEEEVPHTKRLAIALIVVLTIALIFLPGGAWAKGKGAGHGHHGHVHHHGRFHSFGHHGGSDPCG